MGVGGQEFAHTEAVLIAAAQADRGGCWAFDAGTLAAIIKTGPTSQSADAQAWSKRAIGYELRAALKVTEPARTAGKFVLIYDDVCTTGTQLDAAAGRLLDQGGASRVEGVVLARAPWRGGAYRGRDSERGQVFWQTSRAISTSTRVSRRRVVIRASTSPSGSEPASRSKGRAHSADRAASPPT